MRTNLSFLIQVRPWYRTHFPTRLKNKARGWGGGSWVEGGEGNLERKWERKWRKVHHKKPLCLCLFNIFLVLGVIFHVVKLRRCNLGSSFLRTFDQMFWEKVWVVLCLLAHERTTTTTMRTTNRSTHGSLRSRRLWNCRKFYSGCFARNNFTSMHCMPCHAVQQICESVQRALWLEFDKGMINGRYSCLQCVCVCVCV